MSAPDYDKPVADNMKACSEAISGWADYVRAVSVSLPPADRVRRGVLAAVSGGLHHAAREVERFISTKAD